MIGLSSTSNLCILVCVLVIVFVISEAPSISAVDSGGHELSENVDTYDLIGLI